MKKKLDYEDLRKMKYLSSPSIDANASAAAYVVAEAEESGEFKKHIYGIATALEEGKRKNTARLLINEEADLPTFSPDGEKLAYLRLGESEFQIWIYDRNTKQHQKLTQMRYGVEQFSWSPDGKKVAFTAPCYREEKEVWMKEMTVSEKKQWEEEKAHAPVVIENLIYKLDDTYGVRENSIRQIGVADVDTGVCEILTDGSMDSYTAVWSPDGKKVGFYGRPYTHVKELKAEMYCYDLTNQKQSRILCDREVEDGEPFLFTPEEEVIFASYEAEKGGVSLKLFLQPLNGNGEKAVSLFPEEEICHGVDSFPVGRTAFGRETPAYQMSKDGEWVYFRAGWKGCEQIYRVAVKGEKRVEAVLEDRMAVHSFCVPVNGKILYTRGDLLTPAELYIAQEESKEQTRLTYSNEWLKEYELCMPEEMWVESYDKQVRIHGFVMKPAGYENGCHYPAVLDIHGGPTCFYAHDFWFEFQMIAAKNMAVVWCDPRGSFGYGAAFAAGAYSWGKESMDDLFAFLDAAIEKGFIDPKRLGVTGGSYGGHMTTRIIGTTKRFRAAVSQRPLVNLATSYGTGDMGFIWAEKEMQTQMENFMYRIEKSPIRNIDRMKTPLLILQGEKDYRCAMEQAEQMFIAMKDRNPEVPVRLVIFPGENHGVTRHGKIHFQIAHLRELTEWFVRFLCEKE